MKAGRSVEATRRVQGGGAVSQGLFVGGPVLAMG